MAKRRRLTPAAGLELGPEGTGFARETPERKSALPPIAGIAGDAARHNALEDVSGAMEAARREGRLAEALPLEAVVEDHLIRDRGAVDEAEMDTLTESLRSRGQQVPIEVMDLGAGRYGLISGWRRLTALRALAERGEGGDTVMAVLRRPEGDAAAYLAMVEENEIRADLSFWERGRIVARAVEAGVFEDRQKALNGLFGSVPRARRSKIGSFVTLVEALDGTLQHPEALSEKAGLALAKRIKNGAGSDGGKGVITSLKQALMQVEQRTAVQEATLLSTWSREGRASSSKPDTPSTRPVERPVRRAVRVTRSGSGVRQQIVLTGPGVDAELLEKIEALLMEGPR